MDSMPFWAIFVPSDVPLTGPAWPLGLADLIAPCPNYADDVDRRVGHFGGPVGHFEVHVRSLDTQIRGRLARVAYEGWKDKALR